MSFLESINNTANGISNLTNSVGGLVSTVNEFELPAIKTEHKVGLANGQYTGIIVIVLGFLALKLFRR